MEMIVPVTDLQTLAEILWLESALQDLEALPVKDILPLPDHP